MNNQEQKKICEFFESVLSCIEGDFSRRNIKEIAQKHGLDEIGGHVFAYAARMRSNLIDRCSFSNKEIKDFVSNLGVCNIESLLSTMLVMQKDIDVYKQGFTSLIGYLSGRFQGLSHAILIGQGGTSESEEIVQTMLETCRNIVRELTQLRDNKE